MTGRLEKWLYDRMVRRGWNVTILAREAGVSRDAVSAIINGGSEHVSDAEIDAVLAALRS